MRIVPTVTIEAAPANPPPSLHLCALTFTPIEITCHYRGSQTVPHLHYILLLLKDCFVCTKFLSEYATPATSISEKSRPALTTVKAQNTSALRCGPRLTVWIGVQVVPFVFEFLCALLLFVSSFLSAFLSVVTFHVFGSACF